MCTLLLQNAQESVEMADLMRSNGKIYVLLAVVLLIFAGIVFFLMFLEHRLSKLEQEVEDESPQN
ncbi:MAG: CcmD family protein [Bacteroidota bacterium]